MPYLLLVCLMLLVALPSIAQRNITPADCAPQVGDYTYMWWPDGVRGRDAEGRWLRCARTGQYGFALDVEKMEVAHLGALLDAGSYETSLTESPAELLGLPPADLSLTFLLDGVQYRCVRGGEWTIHSGPRLIEGGRVVQRADVTGLIFENEAGDKAPLDARLETIAWPDRLTFLLEAWPRLQQVIAGPSFGRVGGGWGLDGTNLIEVAASPELDPSELTLELWCYLPENAQTTAYYPWLACKGGNEWADGHYGMTLINGHAAAFLNLGGGSANCFSIDLQEQPLATESWHHLALTYDGQTMRLYVDGVERRALEIGRPRIPTNTPLVFGGRGDKASDGYHFVGNLDEIRLYNRALVLEEIQSHFASPETASQPEGLVREWLFNETGQAAAKRPTLDWQSAKLGLSLRTSTAFVHREVEAKDGAEWSFEAPRSVSVSLEATSDGLVEATARPATTVRALSVGDGVECPVEYEEARGWWQLDLGKVARFGEHNDTLERVAVTLSNPTEAEQTFRLLFNKPDHSLGVAGIAPPTGLSPLLCDEAGVPCGLPVQLSKNWHYQPSLKLRYQGAWLHAFSFVRVPANSTLNLEFRLAWAHWGGVGAASHAQLCLIGWGSNQVWDQSAIGCWGESICFEPDQAQAHTLICDVRPLMVSGMRSTADHQNQWTWTNNVGGGDLVRYFDAAGVRQFPAGMRERYLRQGPVLTEVTYAGHSADGALAHEVTVSLWRTDDYVRGLYHLRLDVLQPTAPSRLAFFQVGSDTYNCIATPKLAWGNATGLQKEWEAQPGGNEYRSPAIELTGRAPWVSQHEAVPTPSEPSGAIANRGLIVREWTAQLGGKPAFPWARERGVFATGINGTVIDLVLPPDVTELQPGDFVEATFEQVILPQFQRDYYGPNEALLMALGKWENTWQLLQREAAGNDVAFMVDRGSLKRLWPALIEVDETGQAEFSLTGGLGYLPVTFTGLKDYRQPVLEEGLPGGEWRPIDQSVHGNDFWQTNYEAETGVWQVTYTLPLDTPGDERVTRRFRFNLED